MTIMTTRKKRRSFEQGHLRKMLVIVDDSSEVEAALLFCANRIVRSSGSMVLAYFIEPAGFEAWMGVRQVFIDEQTNKAKALFRLFRRKLANEGYGDLAIEDVIREGVKSDEIVKLIDEDEDIALLVLGAAVDAKGPGPLVSSLAAGKTAGSFPIPITIVPGGLTPDEVKALA